MRSFVTRAVVIGSIVPCCSLALTAQEPTTVDVASLLARAGVRGSVTASCRAEFRLGHPGEFAVAIGDDAGGGRYLVVQDDGQTHDLDTFAGKPDLTCYSLRDADRLNADIAASTTVNGRVVAEWDGMVVCGFIEPTIAVCWQFAPEKRGFVRIGGWTT